MSEQVGSVTHKKSSDFHGGIRFQSSFTIRWELEDKNFLKIDIGCGHTWDLTLVKGFNRGKKDVKKLYYSKTH